MKKRTFKELGSLFLSTFKLVVHATVNKSVKTDSTQSSHLCPEMQVNEIQVSFSYHFIFDIITCVLVTFYKRGHFVMLIIKSMHLIKLHFWTYLKVRAISAKIIY